MCNPAIQGIRVDGGRAGAFQLLAVTACAIGAPSLSVNASSGTGILAMVASEKKRLRSSCHSSCCSKRWLLTKPTFETTTGKIQTTLVRCLISALLSAPRGATLNHPSGLVLHTLRRCYWGNWGMPARKSIDSEQSTPSGFRDRQPVAISDHHPRHYLHVPAEAAIEVGGWHRSRRREAGVVQRPAHKCFDLLIKELADTIGVVLHHHGLEGLPWQKELDWFDHQYLEPKHWQELQVLFSAIPGCCRPRTCCCLAPEAWAKSTWPLPSRWQ